MDEVEIVDGELGMIMIVIQMLMLTVELQMMNVDDSDELLRYVVDRVNS